MGLFLRCLLLRSSAKQNLFTSVIKKMFKHVSNCKPISILCQCLGGCSDRLIKNAQFVEAFLNTRQRNKLTIFLLQQSQGWKMSFLSVIIYRFSMAFLAGAMNMNGISFSAETQRRWCKTHYLCHISTQSDRIASNQFGWGANGSNG